MVGSVKVLGTTTAAVVDGTLTTDVVGETVGAISLDVSSSTEAVFGEVFPAGLGDAIDGVGVMTTGASVLIVGKSFLVVE